ncbi:MAG TPA: hypothetical protein PLK77_09180 [Pyrinomonadaceae bacterium]|nr:hypothetical protein [Pyrinomonadaceae bacterium]
MWVITYHAIPKPGTDEFNKSGGAYVDCWILYAWEDGAEYLARYEVEKEWTIIEKVGASWIEDEDIAKDDEDREYYEQVLLDGGTFVYNKYPLDANDEDDEDFQVDEETGFSEGRLRTDH